LSYFTSELERLCAFKNVGIYYLLIYLFRYAVPKPREQCTKGEQLAVTFTAGYIAGVFCAIVSHPADTVVSKLNQDKHSTALGVAKKLGFAGLWKGLVARIIMIGTLTAAQWFIYDAVKVAFGKIYFLLVEIFIDLLE